MTVYRCQHCQRDLAHVADATVQIGLVRFVLPKNGFTVVCVACGYEQRVYPPVVRRVVIAPISLDKSGADMLPSS